MSGSTFQTPGYAVWRNRNLLPAFLCAFFFIPPVLLCAESDLPQVAAATQADEDLPVAALADELFKQIENKPTDEMWDAVNRLVRLGRTNGAVVTDKLDQKLNSTDLKTQLACGYALCQLNSPENSKAVLCKLVLTAPSIEMRRTAANAIGVPKCLSGDEEVSHSLSEALKKEEDGQTRIAIARSLWHIGSSTEGRDALLRILSQSPEKYIRDEAALVLAENNAMHVQEVRLRLINLYNEPTPHGERARTVLNNHAEQDTSRTRDNKLVQGEQLLRELLRTIKTAYPDESKWDMDRLFEDAAKGMIAGLDPYSQYMDRDDVKATQEMLQQDYGGIGAYVGVRNGSFVVTSPIYGSPADRAGLRALDVIQEVDGVKSSDLMDKGGISGVINKLKGKPGSTVRLKYYRRGFSKAVEVSIVRESIRVESVFSAVLPADIGYVRLTRFGERSVEEMQAALENLLKTNKCKALVLDLRDNPGGLLRSGVDIADMFLDGGKLIVYSEGNKEFAPKKTYFSTGTADDETFPMVCLVSAGSASASEIVAGALQDHKRAVLVGEKTFGKGSVQQIMPVRATDRQTQLRLTVAKYYLPSGRCIHEKGVEADLEVKPPESHSWIVENLMDLRKQAVFEDYVHNNWEANKELFARLAYNDECKCENWPNFDAFYTGLKTRLDRDEIRQELRNATRRRVQDEQRKEFVFDLEEDEVLQRGVLELTRKLNLDPLTISDYKMLPEKFKKKEDTTGAMLLNRPIEEHLPQDVPELPIPRQRARVNP